MLARHITAVNSNNLTVDPFTSIRCASQTSRTTSATCSLVEDELDLEATMAVPSEKEPPQTPARTEMSDGGGRSRPPKDMNDGNDVTTQKGSALQNKDTR
ncbi:hypothetical protein PIB30_104387 [Stylosanthes scabra]|uniref:Uncharacterized protein n=1 Tax=Stylosanthes scabra TaxID=79078 RepID=A0ABU6WZ03_9FABA|nr:hypothetical protein [Stylosanthes scabra]